MVDDKKESSQKIDLATSNDMQSEDSETETIESTSSIESLEKEKECLKKDKEESNEDENHLEENNEEQMNDKKEDEKLLNTNSKVTEKKKKKKSESPKKKISQSEKTTKKRKSHSSDKISRRNISGTMDRSDRNKVKRSNSLGKDKNELEPQKTQSVEAIVSPKSPQPRLRSSIASSGRKIGNRISTWAKKGSREFETRERSSTSVQLTRRPSPIFLSEKKRSISHEDVSPTNSRETISKRELVIKEIITTETQYLGDIDLVIAQFLIPMRAKEKDIPKEIIQKIFGNIEVIRDVNSDILKELETRQKENGNYNILVGDIFLNLVGFRKYRSSIMLFINSITLA